jgi:hypothetical protein
MYGSSGTETMTDNRQQGNSLTSIGPGFTLCARNRARERRNLKEQVRVLAFELGQYETTWSLIMLNHPPGIHFLRKRNIFPLYLSGSVIG